MQRRDVASDRVAPAVDARERGECSAEQADRFDQGVAAYQERLLDAARPDGRTDALDVCCGTGKTTRELARLAVSGRVVGVDLSEVMLELARDRARHERVHNVSFERADARLRPFRRAFDLAVSRHGAACFGEKPAAFANLAAALRPGGRLVVLAWQPPARNEWLRIFGAIYAGAGAVADRAAEPGAVADPDQVRMLLESAGFAGVQVEPVHEPMFLGDDVEAAERFVTGRFGWPLDGAGARQSSRERLRENLHAHQVESGVFYGSAGWLVTAVRAC